MARKPKQKIELKEDERLETPYEVFMRNYKNVPGFRIILKLGIYFLLISFMLIVLFVNQDVLKEEKDKPKEENTTTTEVAKTTYQDLLEDLYKNKKTIDIDLELNEVKYHINYTNENAILNGYVETTEGQHIFKVENNKVYEIVMKEEKESEEILKDIDLNYLIPANLVSKFNKTMGTKSIDKDLTIYNYDIDGIKYIVESNEKEISKITITGENYKYIISYS